MIVISDYQINLLGLMLAILFVVFFFGRIFCWYKFYDYHINGVFLVAAFFKRLPIYSLNINEISYIEKHRWNEYFLFKRYLASSNRWRSEFIIIQTHREFYTPLLLTPDNADEFVSQLRKINPGIVYYTTI